MLLTALLESRPVSAIAAAITAAPIASAIAIPRLPKTCSETPCGACATGCPTDGKPCKLPSGRAASRNGCMCNYKERDPCAGNLTRCQPLPPPSPLPPLPPPSPSPGCLKNCSETPCGACATGCPTDGRPCKLPSGRDSSRHECKCNKDEHSQCAGNLRKCRPPFPSPQGSMASEQLDAGGVQCICFQGYVGRSCEQHRGSISLMTDDEGTAPSSDTRRPVPAGLEEYPPAPVASDRHRDPHTAEWRKVPRPSLLQQHSR